MIVLGMVWGLLASLGPREIIVVALVALVLYGRSGVRRAQHGRTSGPRTGAGRRVPAAPWSSRATWGDRLFWFVAAWIVTRTMIIGAPGVSH